MNKFLEELNKRILVMDGAMGTQLMDGGVRPEDCFDAQNIKNPKLVESIHKAYVAAGADIIETNTFGANQIKLTDYKLDKQVREINLEAAKIARKAIGQKGFVCGSIGPLGKMIDPLGEVTFDQACQAFAEQAKALEDGGVDVISVETISDLQEMRAAVIAVKNETKLPLIASLTYDDGEKTIYGTSAEVAVVVLEALGVDVIAANCSIGPEGMLKVVKAFQTMSSLPVMVMPNAGMPELVGNKAVYKMTPKKFGWFAAKFAKLGVRIIGGCCGTGPEHIRAVKKSLKPETKRLGFNDTEPRRSVAGSVCFASRTRVVVVEESKPLLVGERINPTGRKALQEEIKTGKVQIIRADAASQTKAGVDLLDVNISVPEIHEAEVMHSVVKFVQSISDCPFSIDSPSAHSLEAGLKTFCGRALLNSVNGKKESLEKMLPLARKYGAAVIALLLDEHGIPKSATDRLRIAERIVRAAHEVGIDSKDIFVDNLVMTAAIGVSEALETLKAIPMIKEKLGVKTILGISNVSHGLPNRAKLNALYLRLAISFGLDAAIVDPTDPEIKKALEAKPMSREKLLRSFKEEVAAAKRSGKPAEKKKETELKVLKFKSFQDIKAAVIDGDLDLVVLFVEQALAKGRDPQKIIDQGLVPGMEVVGRKFNRKEFFLPQVIESAEAMGKGFELCKAKIPQGKIKSLGKVLLATVKGDIHDIGKNIVKMLLENNGFTVIDLGKDVPPEKIVEAAKKEKPDVIALSALLTTTMVEMGIVEAELKKAKLAVPLLVGGAVVTKGYADRIGAYYGMDAVGAVSLSKKIMKAAAK
ncbi:MAG: homocysteine S-methyltransferase family protein [Candidatus Margulisiibacteriota bacterium]